VLGRYSKVVLRLLPSGNRRPAPCIEFGSLRRRERGGRGESIIAGSGQGSSGDTMRVMNGPRDVAPTTCESAS